MTNILTKTLRSSFLILAFSLFINNVSAQTCGTPPTCEELGYTVDAVICKDLPAIKCPFDKTKLFCGKNCLKIMPTGEDKFVMTDKNVFKGINETLEADECILYAMSCAKGLVYDKSCQCCNWPADECIKTMPTGGADKFVQTNKGFRGLDETLDADECIVTGVMSCATGLVYDKSCKCCNWL